MPRHDGVSTRWSQNVGMKRRKEDPDTGTRGKLNPLVPLEDSNYHLEVKRLMGHGNTEDTRNETLTLN